MVYSKAPPIVAVTAQQFTASAKEIAYKTGFGQAKTRTKTGWFFVHNSRMQDIVAIRPRPVEFSPNAAG